MQFDADCSLLIDDFADFQGASSSTPAAPVAQAPVAQRNVFDMLNPAPSQVQASASVQTTMRPGIPSSSSRSSIPQSQPKPPTAAPSASKPASAAGGFDDLWGSSLASLGGGRPASQNSANTKKSMLDLDREKTMGSLWAAPGGGSKPAGGASSSSTAQNKANDTFGDLLG